MSSYRLFRYSKQSIEYACDKEGNVLSFSDISSLSKYLNKSMFKWNTEMRNASGMIEAVINYKS